LWHGSGALGRTSDGRPSSAAAWHFDIDLVLRDTSTSEILCVLDTKYKDTTTPAPGDIAQIVAYAEKMGCQEAILVYPRSLPRPFEARVGDIRVRSLPFPLDGDVEEAGHRFMRTVLGEAPVSGYVAL
jgi:5-methylcytosine-specific restriction enzyme subunit McrC